MQYALSSERLKAHDDTARSAVVIDNDNFVTTGFDRTVKIWTRKSQDSLEFLPSFILVGHSGAVFCCCYILPNQSYPNGAIASGSSKGEIIVWDVKTGQILATLAGHQAAVSAICYTVSNNRIVSGSWDGSIRVWENHQTLQEIKQHSSAVQCLIPLPEANSFASTSSDGSICVFKDGQTMSVMKGHQQPVRSLILLNGRQFVSVGNDGIMIVWNEHGQVDRMTNVSSLLVYTIAAINQSTVATAGEDRMISIWSLSDFSKLQSLSQPSPINCIKRFPNGDILSVSDDGGYRIWTTDASRTAKAEDIVAYDERLTNRVVSGIVLKDLPGEEVLAIPGTKDGEIKVIRVGVIPCAYKWSEATRKWDLIGEVLQNAEEPSDVPGVPPGTIQKQVLNGKEYDIVFPVELDGGVRYQLGLNADENAYQVAQDFIYANNLDQNYLITIANFINERKEDFEKIKALRSASKADREEIMTNPEAARQAFESLSQPLPTAQPQQPSPTTFQQPPPAQPLPTPQQTQPSSQPQVTPSAAGMLNVTPNSNGLPRVFTKPDLYITKVPNSLKGGNLGKMFEMITKENATVSERWKLTESELKSVEAMLNSVARAPQLEYLQISTEQFHICTRKMLFWPAAQLFPCLDLLRIILVSNSVIQRFTNNPGDLSRLLIICQTRGLHPSANFRNRVFSLQLLANLCGSRLSFPFVYALCDELLSCCESEVRNDKDIMRMSVSNILFNLVAGAQLFNQPLDPYFQRIGSILMDCVRAAPKHDQSLVTSLSALVLICRIPAGKTAIIDLDYGHLKTLLTSQNENVMKTTAVFCYEMK
ncbi:putative Phospholipase A-2-activating protein [Blattamonas nauphoetae]|uniref:Phospholipase A-2-activating protein n=1 Tax=Blattamonas nauphoetae TaxID=2049346 RepID=A0ABQ9XL05_9EUKA|nr:putative Phospholipase A-2-activating protein [Blattamonas nauphoetae]